MPNTLALAPVPLLQAPELTASAKLIWLVLSLHSGSGPVGPAAVEEHSGLSRKTVLKGLAELAAYGWHSGGVVDRDRRTVSIPSDLLANQDVGILGRLLYGHLQLVPTFTHPRGEFTYAHLSDLIAAHPQALRYGIRELVQTGWLEIAQANRRAPVRFLLCNPVIDHGVADLVRVQQRLTGVKYFGEVLMREYLSLLVDSDNFQDNASPGFLVNPFTDERLQFDRFYPPSVAFEFQGPQHYGATEHFPEETSAQQQGRDLIKRGICAREGIRLVIVHPRDLTVETMRRLIGDLRLRNLKGHEPLVDFLRNESRRYRRIARNQGWRTR